jgi:hypothetical protein
MTLPCPALSLCDDIAGWIVKACGWAGSVAGEKVTSVGSSLFSVHFNHLSTDITVFKTHTHYTVLLHFKVSVAQKPKAD